MGAKQESPILQDIRKRDRGNLDQGVVGLQLTLRPVRLPDFVFGTNGYAGRPKVRAADPVQHRRIVVSEPQPGDLTWRLKSSFRLSGGCVIDRHPFRFGR
jgi:hypothetical protein